MPITVSPEVILENRQLIMTEDPVLQMKATQHFRRLLSIEKNPPIQQVIDAGIIPRLIEFLQNDTDTVKNISIYKILR